MFSALHSGFASNALDNSLNSNTVETKQQPSVNSDEPVATSPELNPVVSGTTTGHGQMSEGDLQQTKEALFKLDSKLSRFENMLIGLTYQFGGMQV